MTALSVGVVQCRCHHLDPEANAALTAARVREAAARGALLTARKDQQVLTERRTKASTSADAEAAKRQAALTQAEQALTTARGSKPAGLG